MRLPLSWLKEHVDFNVSTDRFVELMMWRGFEVSGVESEMEGISGVVVGRILAITKHPDADKLLICSLDVGRGAPVGIVTGAANVFEGAFVPVALDGATLSGGTIIRPTVMRGVESFGMLCSGAELNLTDADYPGASVHGILILEGEQAPGDPIAHALGMDDIIFDIELTPNRSDCQSVIGMSREVAAALGQKFKEPVIRAMKGEGRASDYASVEVLNSDLCPRYAARVVTDLKIAPSPGWMQRRLRSVGIKAINNIVDITNYVLAEYGHPMHAFDLACVAGGHIVVRNAYEGERVTTLDEKEREVTPDMLLIADPEKGVGVAGIIGGLDSEITENTRATLFEAAVFKSSNIRSTARKLNRVTDAAQCFMRGVEAVNAMMALNRAVELVDELGAGRVVGDAIDVCAADTGERVVDIDCSHVNRILNTDIPPEEMARMLGTINIASSVNGTTMRVHVPHFRTDIESGIEADWDIAEEIGRIYGYYNIVPTLMAGNTFRGGIGEAFRDEDAIKDALVSEGAYEMYNFNFTGPAALDAILLPEDDEKRLAVRIVNPFGEEQSLMRTTLLIGMLDSLARNCARKTGHGRFFEVGNVHIDNNPDLPEERKMLGLIYSGANEDFFTLKGSVEALMELFNVLGPYEVRSGGGAYFQPGQKALILIDGEVVGEMGAVHPAILKHYNIPEKAYFAELSVSKLSAHKRAKRTYKEIPKYPRVQRDIALVVDGGITSGMVSSAIASAPAGVIIEDVRLFDVYKGQGIPDGKKSMAFTFMLRSDERTLSEEDIRLAMDAVLRAVEEKFGAKLRS